MERSSKSGNARLQIPWDNPSLLLLRVAAGFEPRQIAQLLEHQHPDIRVLSIDETARKEHLRLESLGSGCAPYSAITWLITILLGSTLLFSSFRARRSSIELLHCYGFGKGLLAIMFAMETFVLTLAGMVVGGGASLFALRICDQYLVIPSGVPLLSGWLSRSAVSILWSIPAFTGLLGVMAGLLVFYILRGELSGLVRNSR
jgi:predicted lysophospholipase L1 biosynthesis ABC-type transport system permease subunit